MKFIINKKDIIGVLSNVQGITGRRSNLAITENLLIKANGAAIRLIATDLETGFEGLYAATVESEGTIAINARKFFEIIRDFPKDEILINEVENRWIEIGNEKVIYHIVGMNPDDFPDIPRIEDAPFFDVKSDEFRDMIEKTVIISGAPDEKRVHISGAFCERIIEGEDKIFRMVSTDGSRLSKFDYRLDKSIEMQAGSGILVPKKGLNEVSKFLSGEGTVQIGIKHNYFIVKKENETFITRLFEGDFPQYDDIISKKEDVNGMMLERQMFLMMLKRMSILSSDSYKGVVFTFGDGRLEITTTNPDLGESKEDIQIDFNRDQIKAAFNPRFFIDTLSVIDEDHIVLTIKDEKTPCFIEAEKEKNYLSVIMPMKL